MKAVGWEAANRDLKRRAMAQSLGQVLRFMELRQKLLNRRLLNGQLGALAKLS